MQYIAPDTPKMLPTPSPSDSSPSRNEIQDTGTASNPVVLDDECMDSAQGTPQGQNMQQIQLAPWSNTSDQEHVGLSRNLTADSGGFPNGAVMTPVSNMPGLWFFGQPLYQLPFVSG
ncbi:hypothetical protein LTS18_005443, partial [Coniosporium uncinatum]